jgi:SAM-dependent MidA family methyltransferase
MTGAGEILRDEIRREGPIRFRRFMEVALYHPELGYYRRQHDPFGASGDFYTAEQLQPVFGILIARRIGMLRDSMGAPGDFTVVEVGAGRAEMEEALREFRYVPVEVGTGKLPDRIRGVVFSNEFFDALPVDAAVMREGAAREMRVGFEGGRFSWVEAGAVAEEVDCYRRRYLGGLSDGQMFEVNLEALGWLERMAAALEEGYVFTIDYGYTAAELARFPGGTLMSYRRHQALEDVLKDPGERDITAHVCFTALEEHGKRMGLQTRALETLARTIVEAGERDQFAEALEAGSPAEQRRRSLELKQLLYGMGETFRTLLQWKAAQK